MQAMERTAWVDVEDGHRLFRIYQRYASVKACRELLREYVFQFELDNIKPEEQVPWASIARQVWDHAIVLGFCVVQQKAESMPVVLPWGEYRFGVELLSNYERRYHVVKKDDLTKIPNTYVLANFGYEPNTDGSLCSIISAIRIKTIVIAQLLDCLLTAEKTRSMPPILVESDKEQQNARQEVSYDFYCESDGIERNEHNAFTRDKYSAERLEAMQNRFTDFFEGGAGLMRTAALDVEGLATDRERSANRAATLASVAPIPSGYKVASRSSNSQAPTHVVDLFRYFEQECYALMQVPRSFVNHDLVRAVDEDLLRQRLITTVTKWQSSLEPVLDYMYGIMHGKQESAVQFRKLPTASTQSIYEAYHNGVIDFKSMQLLVAANCGFDIRTIDDSVEPLPRVPTGQAPATRPPQAPAAAAPPSDKNEKPPENSAETKRAKQENEQIAQQDPQKKRKRRKIEKKSPSTTI